MVNVQVYNFPLAVVGDKARSSCSSCKQFELIENKSQQNPNRMQIMAIPSIPAQPEKLKNIKVCVYISHLDEDALIYADGFIHPAQFHSDDDDVRIALWSLQLLGYLTIGDIAIGTDFLDV